MTSAPPLRSLKRNARTLTPQYTVYLPPMGVDVVSMSVFCDTPFDDALRFLVSVICDL